MAKESGVCTVADAGRCKNEEGRMTGAEAGGEGIGRRRVSTGGLDTVCGLAGGGDTVAGK